MMKRVLFILFLIIVFSACDKCDRVVCDACPGRSMERSYFFKWSLDALNDGFKIAEVDTFYLTRIDKVSAKRMDTFEIISTNGRDYLPYTALSSIDSLSFTIGEDNLFNYEIFIPGLISYQITDLVEIGSPGNSKSCCSCYITETKTAMVNGQPFDFKRNVFVLEK